MTPSSSGFKVGLHLCPVALECYKFLVAWGILRVVAKHKWTLKHFFCLGCSFWLEIKAWSLVLIHASLCSFLNFLTRNLEVIYQTRMMVFDQISEHREESLKYDT